MKDDIVNIIDESVIEELKHNNSILLLSIENKERAINKLRELVSIQDLIIKNLNKNINISKSIQKKMFVFIVLLIIYTGVIISISN
jgi:hypothetical protein